MPLKQITERIDAASVVRNAIKAHRGAVVKGIHKLLAPGLRPGEQMPDLDFLLTLFDRALERLVAQLERAESVLGQRRAREAVMRLDRRRLTKVLYGKVAHVRGHLAELFGRPAATALTSLWGRTSQVTLNLLNQAWMLEKKLSAPDLELPEPVMVPKEGLDPAAWVAEFKDEAAELTELEPAVAFAGQRTVAAVERKKLRLERFNHLFVKLAGALAALFVLAGCERQARTIQPSKQDPGQLRRDAKRRRATSKTLKAQKAASAAEPDDEEGS